MSTFWLVRPPRSGSPPDQRPARLVGTLDVLAHVASVLGVQVEITRWGIHFLTTTAGQEVAVRKAVDSHQPYSPGVGVPSVAYLLDWVRREVNGDSS